MDKKKTWIAIILLCFGTFFVILDDMSGGHSDLLWFAGIICYIVGAVIMFIASKKFRKSKKKDDEETKKW